MLGCDRRVATRFRKIIVEVIDGLRRKSQSIGNPDHDRHCKFLSRLTLLLGNVVGALIRGFQIVEVWHSGRSVISVSESLYIA